MGVEQPSSNVNIYCGCTDGDPKHCRGWQGWQDESPCRCLCHEPRAADEPSTTRADLETIAAIFQHWLDFDARLWREHCKEEPTDDVHMSRSMPETPRRSVVKAWVAALRASQPPNDPRPAEYAALIRAFADWWLDHHDDSRFFNEAMQASPVLAVGMGDTLRQALTKTVRIEPNPLRDWEVPDEKSARCMAAVADAKCVREAGHSGDHYWGPASHPDNCQCNTCYTRKTVAAVETSGAQEK